MYNLIKFIGTDASLRICFETTEKMYNNLNSNAIFMYQLAYITDYIIANMSFKYSILNYVNRNYCKHLIMILFHVKIIFKIYFRIIFVTELVDILSNISVAWE